MRGEVSSLSIDTTTTTSRSSLTRQVSGPLDVGDCGDCLNCAAPLTNLEIDRGDILLPHLPRQFHDLPKLKRISCALSTIGVAMFFSMAFSIVATFMGGKVSYSREELTHTSPLVLPPIGVRNNSNSYANLDDEFGVRVLDCLIRDGDYAGKSCDDITHRLHTCYIPLFPDSDNFNRFMCFNDDDDPAILADPDARIMIEGWFGSPRYRYVDFELVYRGNASQQPVAKTWGTSLAVFDHGVDTERPQWRSWYHTFGLWATHEPEIFFDHVTKTQVASHGFESLFGYDLTDRSSYTQYSSDYVRSEGINPATDTVFINFFFRSSLREIGLYLRQPSILSTLEDAGGLWSAMVGVMVVGVYCSAYCIYNMVQRSCIKDDRGYSAEFKSDEKVVFKEFLESLYESGALNDRAEYGALFRRLRMRGYDRERQRRIDATPLARMMEEKSRKEEAALDDPTEEDDFAVWLQQMHQRRDELKLKNSSLPAHSSAPNNPTRGENEPPLLTTPQAFAASSILRAKADKRRASRTLTPRTSDKIPQQTTLL